MSRIKLNFFLGEHLAKAEKCFKEIEEKNIIQRIWDKDYSVWSDNPKEISNRLGWLTSSRTTLGALNEINDFVHSVRADNFTHLLLLGMGGSSLAPEVFRLVFGIKDGYLDSAILDSTDPGAVLECAEKFDPAKTLYMVSTKSGGTVETLSFMKYFYNLVLEKLGAENVGRHFAAVTDPGSGLESIAKQLNFRKIFLNEPDIGGRYSALSFFGMVPAALLGVDLPRLIVDTEPIIENSKQSIDNNISAQVGAVIGELSKIGKDKLTFIISKQIAPLGAWIEQLIAESTGKNGKGILPVVDEAVGEIKYYSNDRLFVNIKMEDDDENNNLIDEIMKSGHPVIQISVEDHYQLGAQFFMWKFATAVAGWCLNIQPFDQPDVESAKIRAKEMLKQYQIKGRLKTITPELNFDGIKILGEVQGDSLELIFKLFFDELNKEKSDSNAGGYISIQAFLKPDGKTALELRKLNRKIQTKYNAAATLGFGPRFLHSTGQLHKGDNGRGLFIQLIADMPADSAIPDKPGSNQSSVSFGILKTAQAFGDREALLDKGRKIITIDLGSDIIGGIQTITNAV